VYLVLGESSFEEAATSVRKCPFPSLRRCHHSTRKASDPSTSATATPMPKLTFPPDMIWPSDKLLILSPPLPPGTAVGV